MCPSSGTHHRLVYVEITLYVICIKGYRHGKCDITEATSDRETINQKTLSISTTKASSAGDWHALNDFQQRYTSTYIHNKRRTNYLDGCLGTRVEWSTYPPYRTVIGTHSLKPTCLWALWQLHMSLGFAGNDNIDNHITLDTYDLSLFINHISWQPSIDTHAHTYT